MRPWNPARFNKGPMNRDPKIRTVWFDREEQALIDRIVKRRIFDNRRNGNRPKHGAPIGLRGDALHWVGVKAELATAIALHLPYTFEDAIVVGKIDVAGRVEVRGTPWARKPHLMIYLEDRDGFPFVLVHTTADPNDAYACLLGWYWGADAKVGGPVEDNPWWRSLAKREDGKCFNVPEDALLGIPALFDHLHPGGVK